MTQKSLRHQALPSPHETTKGMPECCSCIRPIRWSRRYGRWVHVKASAERANDWHHHVASVPGNWR